MLNIEYITTMSLLLKQIEFSKWYIPVLHSMYTTNFESGQNETSFMERKQNICNKLTTLCLQMTSY